MSMGVFLENNAAPSACLVTRHNSPGWDKRTPPPPHRLASARACPPDGSMMRRCRRKRLEPTTESQWRGGDPDKAREPIRRRPSSPNNSVAIWCGSPGRRCDVGLARIGLGAYQLAPICWKRVGHSSTSGMRLILATGAVSRMKSVELRTMSR